MSEKLNTAVAVMGIDIGKNSFHVIGLDARGAIALRQKWSRGQVETRLANMPPCLIGMEACVGAHHLSRRLKTLGHDARLMPAKYVRPYSKGQKNDFRDGEAIAEAVQRPTMKFVATKTAEQLDLQALHRVRERLVSQRTGIINQIRAFLLERGVAVRQGLRFLRAGLPQILATRTDVLSPRMVHVIEALAGDWRRLDERIEGLSADIETLVQHDPACQRLMTVPTTGYQVAWKQTGGNQFVIWNVDANGKYISNGGALSGTSYALEFTEYAFGQDLNGDGVTGLSTTVIQTDSTTLQHTNGVTTTSLVQLADQYALENSSGAGPHLMLNGAPVTVGEIPGWAPIGAVATSTGYQVAWKQTGGNEFVIWSVDANGKYISNGGALSGTSYALEFTEYAFGQDLNGDGVTGLTSTVIRTNTGPFGSTSLVQLADQYALENSSGAGPHLMLNGAPVTAGEIPGWAPIGAVATSTGYQVAWKETGASQFVIWNVAANGNYISNGGALSGTSVALEQAETTFGQDLNGDGVTGLYAAPNTMLQIGQGAVTIGSGATAEITAADAAPVTFIASTGTLLLDHPATFTGQISGFTGDGTLLGSDHIDLKGIAFSGLQDSYNNGVLTVSNGPNSANLHFSGTYTLANFHFVDDGQGGTIVYDPPVPGSSQVATSSAAVGTGSGAFAVSSPGQLAGNQLLDAAQSLFDHAGVAGVAALTTTHGPWGV